MIHSAQEVLKLEESDRGHYEVEELSLDQLHLRRFKYKVVGYKNNEQVHLTYHADYVNMQCEVIHYHNRGYEPKGKLAEQVSSMIF